MARDRTEGPMTTLQGDRLTEDLHGLEWFLSELDGTVIGDAKASHALAGAWGHLNRLIALVCPESEAGYDEEHPEAQISS